MSKIALSPNNLPDQEEKAHTSEGVARQIGSNALSSAESLEPIEHWRELEQALNSEIFINKIHEFPQRVRNDLIGQAIKYLVVHRTAEGLDDYLDVLRGLDYSHGVPLETEFYKPLIQTIADRLHADPATVDGKKQIFDFYRDRYLANGYYYHAFNGCFEQEINKSGLSNEKRIWDWDGLREISAIGYRHNNNYLLGNWVHRNSEGNTFVSSTPRVAYRYGVASPEWFAQFVSEATNIPNEDGRKEAFYYRDYEKAKSNVLYTLDRLGDISPEERDKVLLFFDKYWAKFAGKDSMPKLALIKRQTVKPWQGRPIETIENVCRIYGCTPESVNLSNALHTISYDSDNDRAVNNHIDKRDILIVNLPEYADIYPRDEVQT